MNKIIYCTLFSLASSISFAQDKNVGIGTTSPAACSILELSSTEKGFLLPRMNTLERLAIPPALEEGLVVFDTDANCFYYYTGSQWAPLGGSYAPIRKITTGASYNVSVYDHTLIVDGTSARTINLPAAASTVTGRIYNIKAINLSTSIIVVPSGADKIDGVASYSFSASNESIQIQNDGSGWWVID